jgi:hypothetical protein
VAYPEVDYQQTLDKDGKACQGQTLSLLWKSVNYGHKKSYSTGPTVEINAMQNTLAYLCRGLNYAAKMFVTV